MRRSWSSDFEHHVSKWRKLIIWFLDSENELLPFRKSLWSAALHDSAAQANHQSMIELFKYRSQIDDEYGTRVLEIACRQGRTSIVRSLLGNIDYGNPRHEEEILDECVNSVANGANEIVPLFIEYGLKIEVMYNGSVKMPKGSGNDDQEMRFRDLWLALADLDQYNESVFTISLEDDQQSAEVICEAKERKYVEVRDRRLSRILASAPPLKWYNISSTRMSVVDRYIVPDSRSRFGRRFLYHIKMRQASIQVLKSKVEAIQRRTQNFPSGSVSEEPEQRGQ